ncbi:unnamed protein product [Acanthoscelides obtectus]|uniref:Uncharacterized protein n=1 Tax=Acanthoscelides obtectus TaxID=200917 RepID=A0A9P0LZM3_ACAOB|nr:unnamed protein product [Acanthoscelides obtectus]CAK1642382.1 hypothetical protein AOBTE_LOCUS13010 [Acanthoscelides obtectus]
MELKNRFIHLKIRRYDISEKPEVIKKSLKIASEATLADLKKELQDLCGITGDKVIKVRYPDNTLIPMLFLLQSPEE